MAQPAQVQQERRRVLRLALRLNATMRDGTRSRVKVRVIDMSTHGCRIECSTTVEDDSWVWLSIAGLENQFSRVVWHCQEFVGLQFEKPLSEAVFDRLLAEQGQLPETAINELREIASRTHWLARQAGEQDIAILAELSRKCALDAVVEGLRQGGNSKARQNRA
jgi:PilZ domain